MVVVTTTIVQLVLGLIGYIYIYSTPPKIYHFCLFHGCGCSSINLLKGEYHVYVYTHVLLCANCWDAHCTSLVAGKYAYCTRTMVNVYCMLTVVMLTAHHWLQGSTRTVRIRWSNQETKNQDCTDLWHMKMNLGLGCVLWDPLTVKPRFLTRAVCNLGSWFHGLTMVRVQYAYKWILVWCVCVLFSDPGSSNLCNVHWLHQTKIPDKSCAQSCFFLVLLVWAMYAYKAFVRVLSWNQHAVSISRVIMQ